MNKSLQRIRLKYHKIEIYTLFFLSPIAVFLFFLLLSFPKNSRILNSDNNHQKNTIFASILEQNKNSSFEFIEYEYKNGTINFIHNLNDINLVAESDFPPKITRLDENTYSIEENYLSNPYPFNKLSKFSFSIKGINRNKQLNIYIIKQVKKFYPQKIFISFDIKDKDKDKLILGANPVIINNIKSFFDEDIARL